MHRIAVFCLAVAAGLAGPPGLAQEQTAYNRVDLSASAQRDVGNDLMIAVVYAEAEDNDQAQAANAVNESIRWAAERARTATGIELQTLQYTTRPVYSPGSRRISRWIARQSLRLESQDAGALSELLGELQQRVAIESLGSELSRAARDATEDALVAEAIAAFERRADLVAGELGSDGYRLVHLSLGTSGFAVRPNQARFLSFGAAADAVAPEIEAGEQTVSVTVNGTIELSQNP